MLPGSVVAMARSARPIAPSRAFATIARCTPRRRYAGRVRGAEDAEHAVGDHAGRRAGGLAVDADQIPHDVRVNELTHRRGRWSRPRPAPAHPARRAASPDTAKPSAVARRNASVIAIAGEHLDRRPLVAGRFAAARTRARSRSPSRRSRVPAASRRDRSRPAGTARSESDTRARRRTARARRDPRRSRSRPAQTEDLVHR